MATSYQVNYKKSNIANRSSYESLCVDLKLENNVKNKVNPFSLFESKFSEEDISLPLKKLSRGISKTSFLIASEDSELNSINIHFTEKKQCGLSDLIDYICDENNVSFDFAEKIILQQHNFINHNKLLLDFKDKKQEYFNQHFKFPLGLKKYAEIWFVLKINKEALYESFSNNLIEFINSFENENENKPVESDNSQDNNYARKRAFTKAETKLQQNKEILKDYYLNIVEKYNIVLNNSVVPKNFIEYSKRENSNIPFSKEAQTAFQLVSWSEKEIAKQITLGTHFLYCKIELYELINYSWQNTKNTKESSNVLIFLDRYKKLSNYFLEEILSYDFPNKRALVIEKIIDIAEELLLLKNFNDFMCILSIFTKNELKLLELSFTYIRENKRLQLINLLKISNDFSNNYIKLRNMEKETCNLNIPFIPCILLALKDLEKLKINYPIVLINSINNNTDFDYNTDKINLERINLIYKHCNDYLKYKTLGYMYKPIFKLSFLYQPVSRGDDSLMILASSLEPSFILYNEQKLVKRLSFNDKYNNTVNNLFNDLIGSIQEFSKMSKLNLKTIVDECFSIEFDKNKSLYRNIKSIDDGIKKEVVRNENKLKTVSFS